MADKPINPTETEKKPDYARGQRQQPAPPRRDHGDFSRGQRKTPKSDEELKHPDYAEGQRDTEKPAGEHPDYARGQDQDK